VPFEDNNPFASSAEPVGAPASVGEGALPPVEVEVSAILSRVGENVGRFGAVSAIVVGILMAVVVISFPVSMMVSIGSAIVVVALGLPEDVAQLGSFGVTMVQTLVNLMLLVGAYRAFLTGVRGGEASPSLLFTEVGAALKLLVATLLLSVFGLVLFTPTIGAGVAVYLGHLGVMEALGVFGVNILLYLPVGLFLAMFTQFLGLVLVDQQLGPVGAIAECWRVTEGYRLLAGVLVVVLGTLGGTIGLVTCGLGAPLVVVGGAWIRLVMYRGMVAINGRSPTSMVTEAI